MIRFVQTDITLKTDKAAHHRSHGTESQDCG